MWSQPHTGWGRGISNNHLTITLTSNNNHLTIRWTFNFLKNICFKVKVSLESNHNTQRYKFQHCSFCSTKIIQQKAERSWLKTNSTETLPRSSLPRLKGNWTVLPKSYYISESHKFLKIRNKIGFEHVRLTLEKNCSHTTLAGRNGLSLV